MDYKTLNYLLYNIPCKIGNFRDLFYNYIYEFGEEILNGTSESKNLEVKTKQIEDYFSRFKKILETLSKNETTIIFENKREFKEFYCTLCILRIPNYFEKINSKQFLLPKRDVMEDELKKYIITYTNENGRVVDFNYYYTSDEEDKLSKQERVTISNCTFKILYSD